MQSRLDQTMTGMFLPAGKIEYYGFAVVLSTSSWDIEVRNRLGHTVTREREMELLFNSERAAREFASLIAATSQECTIHSLGVGDDWNRIPTR